MNIYSTVIYISAYIYIYNQIFGNMYNKSDPYSFVLHSVLHIKDLERATKELVKQLK